MTGTPLTPNESLWAERVRAWRASGLPAPEFSYGKGFASSTLRYWSSRLRRFDIPQFVPLVRRPAAEAPASELLVEVGAARVRVTPGFDAALLADVVRALGGVGGGS